MATAMVTDTAMAMVMVTDTVMATATDMGMVRRRITRRTALRPVRRRNLETD